MRSREEWPGLYSGFELIFDNTCQDFLSDLSAENPVLKADQTEAWRKFRERVELEWRDFLERIEAVSAGPTVPSKPDDPVKVEYDRACAEAWAEWDKVQLPAMEEYERACRPAWAADAAISRESWAMVCMVSDPAREKFEQTVKEAREVYHEKLRALRAEYELVRS